MGEVKVMMWKLSQQQLSSSDRNLRSTILHTTCEINFAPSYDVPNASTSDGSPHLLQDRFLHHHLLPRRRLPARRRFLPHLVSDSPLLRLGNSTSAVSARPCSITCSHGNGRASGSCESRIPIEWVFISLLLPHLSSCPSPGALDPVPSLRAAVANHIAKGGLTEA